jgi:hypothetical protein
MKCPPIFARLALLCAASLLLPAQAETIKLKLAPGLWEQTSTTLLNGQNMEEMRRKQMEQAMSQLTPEQRAQMEKSRSKMTPEQRAQMDKAMGHGNAASPNGVRQSCLTAEQVAKGFDLDNIRKKAGSNGKDCTMNVTSASETGGRFEMVCTSPRGTSQKSIGEYKLKNDKEWRFSMVSSATLSGPARSAASGSASAAAMASGLAAGKMQINIDVLARWKGSDCGNVKPLE